jgi:hypothetical protein
MASAASSSLSLLLSLATVVLAVFDADAVLVVAVEVVGLASALGAADAARSSGDAGWAFGVAFGPHSNRSSNL